MRHPDNRIHWRADLVTHVRQKVGFSLIGGIRRLYRLFQLGSSLLNGVLEVVTVVLELGHEFIAALLPENGPCLVDDLPAWRCVTQPFV